MAAGLAAGFLAGSAFLAGALAGAAAFTVFLAGAVADFLAVAMGSGRTVGAQG